MLGTLDVFHFGLIVADLDASMAAVGSNLGIGWAPVQARSQRLRTYDGRCLAEDIRFTYSSDGPPHVELIECGPDSVWGPRDRHGIHHVGAYADDITTAPGEGLQLQFGGGHDEIPAGFAYYVAAGGLRVELVDAARREEFGRWLAGGRLDTPVG